MKLVDFGRVAATTGKEAGSLARFREDSGPVSWHLGETVNVFPRRTQDFQDLKALVDRFVVPGHRPHPRPFRSNSKLLTLGSCFAEEIRDFLAEKQPATQNIWVPSGLNNTYALRQFIEWCLTGNRSEDAFWYDQSGSGKPVKWTPSEEREGYRRTFETAAGFVFTLGLAEVWADRHTGGVFWRGVPEGIFDSSRHVYRTTSVDENADNLSRIVRLIHEHLGARDIVFTLSPVPLKATFKDESCITADCVSKSILRVALDAVMARRLDRVHYWPSFEIVRWLGGHLPFAVYGTDDALSRHVSRRMVALIIESFVESFFEAEPAAAEEGSSG